ncbi:MULTISPECIES: hypothetical protein [Peribacillus]|uniref:hypothetical protein n=1 Tax=Peribacillus TaxID=2675229 RepID=UPI001F4D6AC2|nr:MULTISPECIES: hypothetical protein [unclassified Peribacillus]MCK1985487.1 hypothetical protein [Peribacillus sp. Aquil_B1]MCK2007779.1 hypothetical protein [Peribacillus sp. Aquil_B8]
MNLSLKRTIGYLTYLVVVLGVLFIGLKYEQHLFTVSRETYEIKGYLLYESSLPVFLGMMFAIPRLLQNFSKRGHWKVNWLRLVILGLPFLYLSIIPILYFTEAFKFDLPLSKFVFGYFGANGSTMLLSITGVVAGYILVTSFCKLTD